MRISDWSSDVCSSDLHSYLRTALEKIGYTVELRGKHGTFEIVGVPKAAREEFSQRREDILNKAAETGITSHKGRDQITINTRDHKLDVEDRGALRQSWIERAGSLGFDGKDLRAAAGARAGLVTEVGLREGALGAHRQSHHRTA